MKIEKHQKFLKKLSKIKLNYSLIELINHTKDFYKIQRADTVKQKIQEMEQARLIIKNYDHWTILYCNNTNNIEFKEM